MEWWVVFLIAWGLTGIWWGLDIAIVLGVVGWFGWVVAKEIRNVRAMERR